MNETFEQDIYEWHTPFASWNRDLQCEFVKWLVDTYGDKGAHQYFNEFRAVKDVMASVQNPIDKQPTHIITSAGMVKMAQEILNNSMKEVYEKHGHNLTGL
jgi:hypothetical protein